MLSIFKVILTICVTREICCFLPIKVSMTCWCFILLVPLCRQPIPEGGVHLLHVSGSDLSHGLDGLHASVLHELHGDAHQSLGKGVHGYCSRAGHWSASWLTTRAQAISVAPLQYTMRLSQWGCRLHTERHDGNAWPPWWSSYFLLWWNGDGSEVLTLLNDQHLVFGGPKRDLFHRICKAQLLSYELWEPRDDVATCGNGDQLSFRSSNLVNRWQIILEK